MKMSIQQRQVIRGAPETIEGRLIDLPPSYVETYRKYTRQGSRVLALAYKSLPDMTVSEARSLDRESVESGITFAGFAVFDCPVRADSATILSELKGSSHDLVMITGDQALTACHVASQIHIILKPVLILTQAQSGMDYRWISPDETETRNYSDKQVETLAETHDLCVGGDCIEMLQRTSAVLAIIPYVKAHVGVALLNAAPPQPISGDTSTDTKLAKQKKSKSTSDSSGKAASGNGESLNRRTVGKSETAIQSAGNRHLTAADAQKQKVKKLMDEMNEDGDGRSAPVVKLGDASMASPFTAKHASVAPTTDIIRQGRSTLVTTLQMFKILGLNCLATAYVQSVMYLDGVKLGDVQATISGVFTAAFFLFISHARPLPTLSAARPNPNIFCTYVFLSLLGQFAILLFFLVFSVKEAEKHMPEECIEPDSGFHPNLANTVSYMVSMILQVATFAVNYMGHPFNQRIPENKPFLYALLAAAGFFTVITSDMFRDLNDWLKLVPLPHEMRDKLLLWAVLMFVACYYWERLLRWAFPGKIPAWRKRHRQAAANLERKKRLYKCQQVNYWEGIGRICRASCQRALLILARDI